jgi:hypothetical protein
MLNDGGTNGVPVDEETRLWVRSLAFTQCRQKAVDALLRMGKAAIPALEGGARRLEQPSP